MQIYVIYRVIEIVLLTVDNLLINKPIIIFLCLFDKLCKLKMYRLKHFEMILQLFILVFILYINCNTCGNITGYILVLIGILSSLVRAVQFVEQWQIMCVAQYNFWKIILYYL